MTTKFIVSAYPEASPDLTYLGRFTHDRPYRGVFIDREKEIMFLDNDIIHKGFRPELREQFCDYQFWVPNIDRISEDSWKKYIRSELELPYKGYRRLGIKWTLHDYEKHSNYGVEWYTLELTVLMNISISGTPYHSDYITVNNVSPYEVNALELRLKDQLMDRNRERIVAALSK